MSARRQKILSTLTATGRQVGTAAVGAAIRTGNILSQSWQEMREKDRQKHNPSRAAAPAAKATAAPAPHAHSPAAQAPAPAAQPPHNLSDFQQALILMAQAYNIPENDTHLMDALKGAKPVRFSAEKRVLSMDVDGLLLDLSPHEIHTGADELTKAQAQRMIRFAAANPSMRKSGITIEGSDETRKLLEELAAEAGLKILNPLTPAAPAQPVITQPVVPAPDVAPPATAEAPADKKPAEPLPPVITKILGDKISAEKYYAARDFLRGKNSVNPHMLQTELDITRTAAKKILSALVIEGYVKIEQVLIEKKNTLRDVYTVAANPPENVIVAETAENPAAGAPADAPKKPDDPRPA